MIPAEIFGDLRWVSATAIVAIVYVACCVRLGRAMRERPRGTPGVRAMRKDPDEDLTCLRPLRWDPERRVIVGWNDRTETSP